MPVNRIASRQSNRVASRQMRVMRELTRFLACFPYAGCSARGECIREDSSNEEQASNQYCRAAGRRRVGVGTEHARRRARAGRCAKPGRARPGRAAGGAAAQDRQSPQGERGKQGQAQERAKQGGQKDQTTGQAPQKEQGAQGRDAQQNKTTGQGERQQGQSPSGAQRDQSPSQPQGQTQQRQEGQQGQDRRGSEGSERAQPGQQKETGGGNVTLTTEQRTKIRQTVLTGNAPRATNVNFSVSVGTAVPTSVRVVAVPIGSRGDSPRVAGVHVLRGRRPDHHRRPPPPHRRGARRLTRFDTSKKGRPRGRPFACARRRASATSAVQARTSWRWNTT